MDSSLDPSSVSGTTSLDPSDTILPALESVSIHDESGSSGSATTPSAPEIDAFSQSDPKISAFAVATKEFVAVPSTALTKSVDEPDENGRTPLFYAVCSGSIERVRQCLTAGADPSRRDNEGISILKLACGLPDDRLIAFVYASIHQKFVQTWTFRLPRLEHLLETIPDFRISLEWKIASWIPFVSRLAPSDKYTITKKGQYIRLDFTMIGYQNLHPVRGDAGLLFLPSTDRSVSDGHDGSPHLVSVNRDKKEFENLLLGLKPLSEKEALEDVPTIRNATMKSVNFEVDVDPGSFKPRLSRKGIPKKDKIGHPEWPCTIFEMENMQASFRFSKRHSKKDLQRIILECRERDRQGHSLSLMGANRSSSSSVAQDAGAVDADASAESGTAVQKPPTVVKAKEFVLKRSPLVWITEDFPFKLTDLVHVLEVLAPVHGRIEKIFKYLEHKNLPDGFPVKFEIPIVSMVAAVVTVTDFELNPMVLNSYFSLDGFKEKEYPPEENSTPDVRSAPEPKISTAGKKSSTSNSAGDDDVDSFFASDDEDDNDLVSASNNDAGGTGTDMHPPSGSGTRGTQSSSETYMPVLPDVD